MKNKTNDIQEIEYNFGEHLNDLISNLYALPMCLYGKPILTKLGIVEELKLFMRNNELIKQIKGEK